MYSLVHRHANGQEYLLGECENPLEIYELMRNLYNDLKYLGPARYCTHFAVVMENDRPSFQMGVTGMLTFDAVKTWNFPSSSNPNKFYRTQLNKDGFFSCQCKGWVMKKEGKHRECSHITEVVRNEQYETVVKGDYLFLKDKKLAQAVVRFGATHAFTVAKTPQEKFTVLVQDYEAALTKMASLPPGQILEMALEVQQKKFLVDGYITMMEQAGLSVGN